MAAALQEANARLRAENAELKAQIAEQAEKIARLERLISRNSGNSSMPPSADDLPGRQPPEPKMRRGGGKRKPGKQKGAPGTFLAWREDPDDRSGTFPRGTCACGADLADAADLGVKYSHQVTDLPEARAVTIQHDRHEVECALRRGGTSRTRPPEAAGAPGTVTYGLNFQAWCVFLMVMHHVPVERCADILESMSGTRPSDGWVHGLLERAARAVAAANKAIRALIILARVICGDETPLRAGPGPKTRKKYLQVACTNLLTYYFLGGRDLPSFKDFVYSDLHGTVVVHDRYVNYDAFDGISHQLLHPAPAQGPGRRRPDLPGGHLARPDRRGAARPDPRRQHRPRPGPGRRPRRDDRGAPDAVPPRRRRRAVRRSAASPARRPSSRPPGCCWNACAHREADVLRFLTDTAIPPDLQPGRTRPAARKDPAEDQRPAPLGESHPRPVRHPRLRLHRRQARDRRPRRHPRRPRRKPLDTTRPGRA